MDYYEIGQRIRKFRKACNFSQEQTDELLYDTPQINKTIIKHELAEIVDSCSHQDMRILLDVVKTLKSALEKYKN